MILMRFIYIYLRTLLHVVENIEQQTYDLCDRSKLSAGLCLHCPSGNNDVK